MITLKLWNSLSQDSRNNICRALNKYGSITEPYHHNFDFDSHGEKLKNVLSCCNLQKDGSINVVVNIIPTKETVKKVEAKKPVVEKKIQERYRYIGYFYEYNDRGERVDDFKEWVDAYDIEDAKDYFDDDHRGCLRWLKDRRAIRRGVNLEGIVIEDFNGKHIDEIWF